MAAVKYYHQIADMLISDIKKGVLKPGDQLLPQREFAYIHNIAPSTASRVYAELVKRGAAIGEVGRGTFIRAFDHTIPELGEPAKEPINMQLNFSVLPEQAKLMTSAFTPLLRTDILEQALEPVSVVKDHSSRKVAADFLSHKTWRVNPDDVLFTGGGRQGIIAAMMALASIGDRIGVEYMTYPIVKGIASRLGIKLVPIDMDEEGICLNSLSDIHYKNPLKAIYIQPKLHNPLGINMSNHRRAEIADFIENNDIYAIEDAVYAFLGDEEPFMVSAPQNTIYIDGLSKRLSPSLGFGFMVVPQHIKERCIASLRIGGWTSTSIAFATCLRWIADGTVDKMSELRKIDAQKRQILAKEILSDFTIHADPQSYHLWMELPAVWRAEEFAAAAARRGIAITPASVFAVEAGSAPNAIRLALAPPSFEQLEYGLKVINELALLQEVEVIIE